MAGKPDNFINKIICGDCLEVMKDWPDNCIKLTIVDPMYNIRLGKNQHYHRRLDDHPNIYWDNMVEKDYVQFVDTLMRILLRISNCVVVTCGNGNQTYYPKPRWTAVWRKMNACTISPLTRGIKINKSCWEPILIYGMLDNPPMFDIIDCPISVQPDAEGHPVPKPLKLFSEIVGWKEGLVFDPMVGSGTTCVAAKKLGRRYIGIDISEEYCKIARQRLKAVDTGVPVKEQRQGQQALFKRGNSNGREA